MKVQPLAIEGPLLITPEVFGDERGFFFESWKQSLWSAALAEHGQQAQPFVQDNHSRSSRGVVRGLHYQLPPEPQAKLVRCVVGEIFDVAVDLRRNSTSFGRWVAAKLSAANHQQLWIPAGFAHGFLCLSAEAEVLYKTTHGWDRSCERLLRWNDPALAIAWPLPEFAAASVQLSGKDAAAPLLAQLDPTDLPP